MIFETENTVLSGIDGKSVFFTNDTISAMLSNDDGTKTLVSFDHDTQLFTIKDKYSVQMYQSLGNSTEFARIYENMVSYQPYSNSFQNLSIRLEETSAVYELVSDGITSQVDIDSEHLITVESLSVKLLNKEQYSGSLLKKYNIDTHSSGTNILGSIMIDIPNQTHIDPSVSSFTVSISAGNQVHPGVYTLNKNEEQSTPEYPVYECSTQFDS